MSAEDRAANNGFWDLPTEDRMAIYDAAYRETGVVNFFDLPAEERGRYYDRATDGQ